VPPTLTRIVSVFRFSMTVSFGCFVVVFELSASGVLFPESPLFLEELISIVLETSRTRSAYRAAARIERATWPKPATSLQEPETEPAVHFPPLRLSVAVRPRPEGRLAA
jgi:hypothetical protein